MLMLLVALLASHVWRAPLRQMLAAIGALFVLVVVLNLGAVPVASDLAKIGFGALAGIAFVRAIERLWWLAPICICVPLADAWSVYSSRGITNAVVERAKEQPAWIEWPTIAVPIGGFDYAQFGRLGTVDVLFAALFLSAAARWRLGLVRGVVALATALVGTSVLVFEVASFAVPALPLLCIAFVAVYAPALVRDFRGSLASS